MKNIRICKEWIVPDDVIANNVDINNAPYSIGVSKNAIYIENLTTGEVLKIEVGVENAYPDLFEVSENLFRVGMEVCGPGKRMEYGNDPQSMNLFTWILRMCDGVRGDTDK